VIPPLEVLREAAKPAGYVPRDASERAVATLLACAECSDRPAALRAAPGLGKTLLLHELAGRLRRPLCGVYVPNPVLEPAELCAWTLGRLGSPAWADPISVLAAYADHLAGQGGALVWLVDDAHLLPEETARWLGSVVARSRGALRLVVAVLDGAEAKALDALGPLAVIDGLA
jgi:MoxR-like ATPase